MARGRKLGPVSHRERSRQHSRWAKLARLSAVAYVNRQVEIEALERRYVAAVILASLTYGA